MPPTKLPTIWEARPHTIAKIKILRQYLLAWFQILGTTRTGEDLLYVDGFAGPGEYTNYPIGSPLAALTAAKESLDLSSSRWRADNIHCAFIELDGKRFNHLKQKVDAFEKPVGIVTHVNNKTFTEGLDQLRIDVSRPFNAQNPLFVFIDPFGATGVPFSVVREILMSRCSEVLINLDADGIARIFHAGEHAAYEEHLNSIFDGEEWKTLLSLEDTSGVLCRKVLQLYKTKLRQLPRVKYVFSFEMRTSSQSLNYYLVFASQHYLGLEKMKEAMRRMDQAGDYCFSDAAETQTSLFRFDNPEQHSLSLYNAFRGKRVTYSELRDFSLNETPYINPKSMLKDLECERDLVANVVSTNPRRRKGTFNEDSLRYVEFK